MCLRSGAHPVATFSRFNERIQEKADEFVFISSAIGPWTWLVTVVIIVAIFKSCFTHGPDPVNDSINKSAEIVDHVMVLDSTKNGFRVIYATAEPVTNENLLK